MTNPAGHFTQGRDYALAIAGVAIHSVHRSRDMPIKTSPTNRKRAGKYAKCHLKREETTEHKYQRLDNPSRFFQPIRPTGDDLKGDDATDPKDELLDTGSESSKDVRPMRKRRRTTSMPIAKDTGNGTAIPKRRRPKMKSRSIIPWPLGRTRRERTCPPRNRRQG